MKLPGASSPSPSPTAAPVANEAGTNDMGTLRLTLFDENGKHPSGVPVDFVPEAGERRSLTSGPDGAIVFIADPGEYAAGVVDGCHGTRKIHSGGTARFRLVGNRETAGRLIVRWERRYVPIQPVSASQAGNWPVNKPVDVTFSVTDRCEETAARNASFSTYTYDTSTNLNLVKTSFTTDGEGRAKVTVRCTGAGDIKLVVRDNENPKDMLDLAKASVGYGGVPRCAD